MSVDSLEQKNQNLHDHNSELFQKIKLLEKGTSAGYAIEDSLNHASEDSTFSLSPSQAHQLQEEMKLFDQFSGIDLGKINTTEFINLQKNGLHDYFETACERVEKKCPLITSVLQALVIGGRNIWDPKYTWCELLIAKGSRLPRL
ncbi:hypothetical protein OS493_012918 [Desmophyllum pertusum]|uniref:Uncharacterized protein n=1 Tax=Desmophyllum pertusum TaxID=174260 RepID=A0A9W9Z1G6_9CNID|nr:hypothetical protein OS493_012918 [Desmophyllum pertusum]